MLKATSMTKEEAPIPEGMRKLPIRPVYLVSSSNGKGKSIISIGMFAFFSSKPPLVGIGIAPSRYSFELIRRSGEYVVNVVDEKLTHAFHVCGENSGRNTDKFKLANLTPEKGTRVAVPLIRESPVSVECKVIKEIETGDHVWFIGEVLATHVRQNYDWQDGLLFKWIGEKGTYFKIGEKIGEY